jgi:hypothetical protein
MNGRIVLSVLLVLVLVALVAGVGIYTYNAGVAQGMVTSGKVTVPEPGVAPYPYYGPFFYRPFGFGFGLFGCLVPLLFFFLIFGLFRAIFWGGPWGWRGRHYWGQGVPPGFEEWHRQAHEPQSSAPTNK